MKLKLVSLIREKQRLRVPETGMLKRIFGPNRGEVAGGRRKLPNEEFHNLLVENRIPP
jgi:hypothetical protein